MTENGNFDNDFDDDAENGNCDDDYDKLEKDDRPQHCQQNRGAQKSMTENDNFDDDFDDDAENGKCDDDLMKSW